MCDAIDRRDAIAVALVGLFGPQFIAAPAEAQSASAKNFMARAFEMKRLAEAAGDQSYGAVVVAGERIIGESPSKVVTDRDVTAHAEMSAIRDASRRGGNLNGATLYSTSRPCSMCQAAAAFAGIGRMIHGAELTDAGSPRGR